MFLPSSLALGQSMVGVMAVMAISFKRTPKTIIVSGLMATSSKRAYASTLCLPGLLLPLLTHTFAGDPQILTGRSGSVCYGGHCFFPLSPGAQQVLFVPSKSLWRVWGLILI